MTDRLRVESADHGHIKASFSDSEGRDCLILETTVGEEPAVMLGIQDIGTRMRLGQDIVAAMLPHLAHFVETGTLGSLLEAGE